MHTLGLRQGERPAVMEITQLNEVCAQIGLLQRPRLNQYFKGNFKSNPRFFKTNPKKQIAPVIGPAMAPPYIF
jgi:hypothetical protein